MGNSNSMSIVQKKKNDMELVDKIVAGTFNDLCWKPFGVLALGHEIILMYCDEDDPMTAQIHLDQRKVLINMNCPLIKDKSGKVSISRLSTIILHEFGHDFIEDGEWVKGMTIKKKYLPNFTGDYTINALLLEIEKAYKSPSLLTETCVEEMCGIAQNSYTKLEKLILYQKEFHNKAQDEIYNILDRKAEYKEEKVKFDLTKHGIPLVINMVKIEFKYKDDHIIKWVNEDVDDLSEHNDKNKQDKQDKEIKKIVKTAEHMLKEVGRGSVILDEMIIKILACEIPWSEVLKDALRTYCEQSNEVSWSRPRMSNFCMPSDFLDLPGFDDQTKYSALIVMMDESGSIGEDETSNFVDIVMQSRAFFDMVIIYRHDTYSTNEEIYRVESINEEVKKKICVRKKCGGTSHLDVFSKVKKLHEKGEHEISLVIGLSDLFSDLENKEVKEIFPKELPLVWVVTKNHNRELANNGNLIGNKVIIINKKGEI